MYRGGIKCIFCKPINLVLQKIVNLRCAISTFLRVSSGNVSRCHYQSFLCQRKPWQSFWWNFDSDNGQRNLWSKTLTNFDGIELHPIFLQTLMDFDGLWWKSTNQNTVLKWWDDVYKTKAHGNKKTGKGKSVARKRNVTASRSAPDMVSWSLVSCLSTSGLTFSRSILNVALSILK